MNIIFYWHKAKMRRNHRGRNISMYALLKRYERAKVFRERFISLKTKLLVLRLKK